MRLEDLANFMAKRHHIYLNRKSGRPGPWTDDPILQNGRFCNIFRELDTVTIWIDQHIRKPYANHPNLWLMLCIARYINWPPTLQQLIDLAERDNVPCWPSHPDFYLGSKDGFEGSSLTWALTQRAKNGDKVYTGAYMIRAESDPSKPWYSWSKHRYIADIVIGRLWEFRDSWRYLLESNGKTLESVWQYFQEAYFIGWGPFMAYEVVTDMRHTAYLSDAPDIYTWANAGPGAKRGLNRVLGRPVSQGFPLPQATKEMFELMLALNDYDEPYFNNIFGIVNDASPRFEMRDVEHTLCEFDKYERVRMGEGQMRAKYDWRKATKL